MTEVTELVNNLKITTDFDFDDILDKNYQDTLKNRIRDEVTGSIMKMVRSEINKVHKKDIELFAKALAAEAITEAKSKL